MSAAQEICSIARWNALCQRFDIAADGGTYTSLIKEHADKTRAYHTLDHIAACLRHLDTVRDITDRPDEIEMALWFHDAVYQPFSKTNEDDSAEWAADWLQDRGAPRDVFCRVADLILATKSHKAHEDTDTQFMLDIDLSILGTDADTYDEFELNIRREYRHVPAFIFRKKRKAILEGFLKRDRLYMTGYFHDKFESSARINLIRTISDLD